MLRSSDVESIVISYLEPHCLASFFIECGLNFRKKFMYDARGCVLGLKEINDIFSVFPGVILTGLSFYDDQDAIMIPFGGVLCCEVIARYDILSTKCLPRQLGEMVNMVELKLINYDHDTKLDVGVWMNLRELTIQIDGAFSSPFLDNISECKRLDTLRLLIFEFCRGDFVEMSKCEKLVNLEIDGLTKAEGCEFAKYKWNVDVLKLGHYFEATNLDILLSCPNVRYVRIVDWEDLVDIDALVKCTKLERVEIVRCPKLMNVSAVLKECVKLRRVRVRDCAEKLNIMGNV